MRDLTVHLSLGPTIVRAVDGADFSVAPGECVGIVGESGSGKSTLARAIIQLMPNVKIAELSGTAMFRGRDLMNLPAAEVRRLRRRNGFSMIFRTRWAISTPLKRSAARLLKPSQTRPKQKYTHCCTKSAYRNPVWSRAAFHTSYPVECASG
ncbi:ATP-binding cassette domain-containing protein (plasmid) [Aquicoccus sp. G2-2]|uniref:ATP-binding cassette domain-containing protein n=1 Tax=Aquicoccus sp. G2-2 TaxID=3092120 RepID=UPI002AE09371|nr:ATP-binding cassette domain-containing protein [Aquicoccus sp. G2-2]MEA1112003.1 ATP-binding cassette domain-containing protein [Aquicoccus sp. G2-2]